MEHNNIDSKSIDELAFYKSIIRFYKDLLSLIIASKENQFNLERTFANISRLIWKEVNCDFICFTLYGETSDVDEHYVFPREISQNQKKNIIEQSNYIVSKMDTDNKTSFIGKSKDATIVTERIILSKLYYGSISINWNRILKQKEILTIKYIINSLSEMLTDFLIPYYNNSIKNKLRKMIKKTFVEQSFEKALISVMEHFFNYIKYQNLIIFFEVKGEQQDFSIFYNYFENKQLKFDSQDRLDFDFNEFIQNEAGKSLKNEQNELNKCLRSNNIYKFSLYDPISEDKIGQLYFSLAENVILSIYDSEFLDVLLQEILLQIIQYNNQRKKLNENFSSFVISRLLGTKGHNDKYLSLRSKEVSILYVSLTNYYQISEKILTSLHETEELINRWSSNAREIIWNLGGVFAFFSGNLIVGLFGPPFYDKTKYDSCYQALQATIEIGEHTNSLNEYGLFSKVKKSEYNLEFGISSAVSFGNMFVGQLGPTQQFTGISDVYKNVMTLHNQAGLNEILVSENVKDILFESQLIFSERLSAYDENNEIIDFYKLFYNFTSKVT